MKISEFFIRKPVTTILLVVALMIFGVGSYFKLPVSDLPNIELPVISVSASYPGASPETMAASVAAPLEKQLMLISGLDNVIATSSDGRTSITLTFDTSKNTDMLIPDIQTAIASAKHDLPPDLPNDPIFRKRNTSSMPVFMIILNSDKITQKQLYDLANLRIAQPLSMMNGVSGVDIQSFPSAIRITVDPRRMAARKITINDIQTALDASNTKGSGGTISGDFHTYSIQPEGELTTPEEYDNIIIRYEDGKPVKIKDIGRATLESAGQNFKLTLHSSEHGDLSNPIILQISKRSDANTVLLANQIKTYLANLEKTLPESVKISILRDSSEKIIESIDDVKLTLFIAFILVVLVIYIFMGRLKDTLIPSVILPVTIFSAFLGMYAFNFSIDNLSLLALTLAIGFVVDDSIVVLENNIRHIEQGEVPFDAAIKSSKEITGSIVSMTLSLIIVFVPLVLMPGIVGKSLKEFSLTVIITIICSGILSLTLTPMMNAHMLSGIAEGKQTRIQKFRDAILRTIITYYAIVLKVFLKKPYLAVIIWLLCIVGTVFFYAKAPKTLLPAGDSGFCFGAMKMPLGIAAPQAHKYQEEVDKVLKTFPFIDKFVTMTGQSEGADQSSGQVIVILKPSNERPPMDKVLPMIRQKLSAISFNLGNIFLMPVPVLGLSTGGKGTAAGTQYSYRLTGISEEEVYKYTNFLKEELKKNKLFTDVQTNIELNMPQIKVKILRDKASSLGVSSSAIQRALSLSFSHGSVTQYTEGTNIYDVIMQLQGRQSKDPESLSQIYVRSSSGAMIPISTVVEWEPAVGPSSVSHYQQMVSAIVSFNLIPGTTLSTATNIISEIARENFPATITGGFEGEAQQMVSTMNTLLMLILIAIFMLYVVLGILYESFTHPFTVLTTLPTALVGGLGTLVLFNSELSLFAYVGMFLLLGIVVKNGIMMVDFALQEMGNNQTPPFAAIYEACKVRFRPILMTGMTSIMGALPIAIGVGADASVRRPLGLMIVGGMVVSQVITLFVTPGIFIYMQKLHDKYLDKYSIAKAHPKRSRYKKPKEQAEASI